MKPPFPNGRLVFPIPVLLTGAILVLWTLPLWWYTHQNRPEDFLWLHERDRLEGWTYSQIPVSKSAQAELGSDQYVNGEFKTAEGRRVSVFSAKRFAEKASDVDIFAHTPDRCWPLVGWKLELIAPETVQTKLAG